MYLTLIIKLDILFFLFVSSIETQTRRIYSIKKIKVEDLSNIIK